MNMRTSAGDLGNLSPKSPRFVRNFRWGFAAVVAVICLLPLTLESQGLKAATNPAAPSPAVSGPAGGPIPLADALGVHFVPGSSSTFEIARDGKTYLVNLADHTIQEKDPPPTSAEAAAHLVPAHSSSPDVKPGAKIFADNCANCHGQGGKGVAALKTPDFTNPAVQAVLSDAAVTKVIREGKPGTEMPAWGGKLSDAEINAVAAFVKSLGPGKKPEAGAPGAGTPQMAKVYTPADDYLFSMPTGRRLDRHGLYFNFTHRFVYGPAFSGTGGGDTLAGLDNFSISSFGLRFGITDKLSVSAYRSPSLIDRPIELGVTYNFSDEHDGRPLNAAARFSVDGQNDFGKNFTTNFELMLSRSVTRRAQLYVDPTVSLQDRRLVTKPGSLASVPPDAPGINTFYVGVGGALDIRPTVAMVAEAFPTLVNGPELGIHRPAWAFGIQKSVLRHAFTFGFSNSPGTVVSQRAGTRASFLGQPWADTPGGLFIGFDLMRQIY